MEALGDHGTAATARIRCGHCEFRDALRATRVIPGYTQSMKTAISVPDEIFDQAARQAVKLGISQSEFFARAARRYLDELAAQSLTSQIDQALLAAGYDNSRAAASAEFSACEPSERTPG